jgi:hypothetical protein
MDTRLEDIWGDDDNAILDHLRTILRTVDLDLIDEIWDRVLRLEKVDLKEHFWLGRILYIIEKGTSKWDNLYVHLINKLKDNTSVELWTPFYQNVYEKEIKPKLNSIEMAYRSYRTGQKKSMRRRLRDAFGSRRQVCDGCGGPL